MEEVRHQQLKQKKLERIREEKEKLEESGKAVVKQLKRYVYSIQ